MRNKTKKAINELARSGFCLTLDELINVTAEHIIQKYGISEEMNEEEKEEFIRELINLCWDNQLRMEMKKKNLPEK